MKRNINYEISKCTLYVVVKVIQTTFFLTVGVEIKLKTSLKNKMNSLRIVILNKTVQRRHKGELT